MNYCPPEFDLFPSIYGFLLSEWSKQWEPKQSRICLLQRVTLNQSDLAPVTPTCIYAYKAELCGHRTYITKKFHERICSFKIPLLLTAALHRLKMLWRVVFRSFFLTARIMGVWCSCTCGCTVVQEDLLGRKSPFPNDELIKGPRHIMTVCLVVARPNEKVGVRVTVDLRDVAAFGVTSGEGSIDIDLQTISFSPREENMSPVGPWMREDALVSHYITYFIITPESQPNIFPTTVNLLMTSYETQMKRASVLTGKNSAWILDPWVMHKGFSVAFSSGEY